uniref:uncharacterized protein LOC100183711 n=1 Tax=Ciona intestinalis TaxID=7719 RepID=UPI000180C316|nr:uncharacterized protein LOC100183711 [Ciona intestinalis]|eukprot:XP_002131632.1 uncharacterized protein LOC100183711 [Ciona intestinalis]
MGCPVSVEACCRDFCTTHGDYAVRAKHGRKVAQAEVDYVRRVSRVSVNQTASTVSQRRASVNSSNSGGEQESYIIREPFGNQLTLPGIAGGRDHRRVSIASNDFYETIIYDTDKPPDTVKQMDSEPGKSPDKGILKTSH